MYRVVQILKKMSQICFIYFPITNDYIQIYNQKYMNRNINMKNNMIKNDEGLLIKYLNIGGQYYLQTRMLSN